MKPRLFLDTNVLLDILLERPGYEDVLEILQMGSDGKVALCTSFLSMANIAYLLRKEFHGGILLPTLKQISILVEILPMDNDQLQRAMMLEGADFEDILQAVCAHGANCQTIITNNRKDFALQPGLLADWSSPEVLSPRDFKNRIMDLGIF